MKTALDRTHNSLPHGHQKFNFLTTETSHKLPTNFKNSMTVAYTDIFAERRKI